MWGIQIVRVQSDNGGEFINGQLISGCRLRGVHMSQNPPSQPQSNGHGGNHQRTCEKSLAWIQGQ
eukprot:12880172-Prorocentrum_lima.AAC.1